MTCSYPVLHSMVGCTCAPVVPLESPVLAMQTDRALVFHGDSGRITLPPNSLDAMVTDPPCGIGFMGKEWDDDKGGADAWSAWLAGLLRPWFDALKPGGHALVWAIPRTSDWTIRALRMVGFEIRDQIHDAFDADTLAQNFVESLNPEQQLAFMRLIESQASPIMMQVFGTGFPKSLNVSKAIDQMLGAERPVIGDKLDRPGYHLHAGDRATDALGDGMNGHTVEQRLKAATITAPGSPEAAQWEGWGTALKPAVEHWILARKPLADTVARNVLTYGTGGLNIDACRIAGKMDGSWGGANGDSGFYAPGDEVDRASTPGGKKHDAGRWPAHLTLDEHTAQILDAQSGTLKSPKTYTRAADVHAPEVEFNPKRAGSVQLGHGDTGGASRFFYVAKGSRKEKDEGLDHLPKRTAGEATDREEGSAGLNNPRAGAGRTGGARNFHPTVKSIALMRWLVQLVTPPGGVVADPFGGSGSTAVAALELGHRVVLCEKEAEYLPILLGRVNHALKKHG